MNKSEDFNKDILTRYISPEKIEKAPAGFSERLMTRIQVEKIPSVGRNHFLLNYKIPLVSGIITAALIISAVITSSPASDSPIISFLKPLSDLLTALPKINFEKFAGITFPGLTIYIALGIFLLSLFDRALNIFFHRDRK